MNVLKNIIISYLNRTRILDIMGFNGKSLILIGITLFIFQIANFFSIETITPELERAQVLAAIASIIIILIGFLFKEFQTFTADKADLKGENKFLPG